jgi:coniferyl-aldehyde dehydrogenase
MREEIFGPVLPIIGYRTLEDAIAHINAQEPPLALYCLARSRACRDVVLSRTISGGVTVNGIFLHNAQEDLPFGGVGMSGIGAYHGFAGFQRFSHRRGIYQVRMLNVLHHLAPPYGKFARLAIRVAGSRRAVDSC